MTSIELTTIMSAQALRSAVDLEPVDGPGGRIYPPTYSEEGHVVETLQDGTKRVLIDSVASQANRQEEALVAARAEGRINFADLYIDLSDTDSDLTELSATEMPHRLSDAILRDSEIGGVAFGQSEVGRSILSATPVDLTAIVEASPTTVLYGCWFSQHNLPRPLKIQRSVVADIWAENAVLGQAVGSRIDPLGIERLELYQTEDGDWTASESEAVVDKGKPKSFGKRPSEINHGNIAPSVREQGITADRITLRWALPLSAVRRLRFGGGERDAAGQTYVVALGLVARTLQHEAGYSLRSRCDLISKGPLSFDVIDRDGAVTSAEIGTEQAIALLYEAEEKMQRAGLAIHQRMNVKPSHKLKGLIAANRRHQIAANEVAA